MTFRARLFVGVEAVDVQAVVRGNLFHTFRVRAYVEHTFGTLAVTGMQKAGEETDLAQSEFKNASQEDCQLDGHGQQPSVVFVMFVEEEQHGLVEHVDVAVGVLLGAFSFVGRHTDGIVSADSTAASSFA